MFKGMEMKSNWYVEYTVRPTSYISMFTFSTINLWFLVPLRYAPLSRTYYISDDFGQGIAHQYYLLWARGVVGYQPTQCSQV